MARKDKGREVREGIPGPIKEVQQAVTIPPPNMQLATFLVKGTAPYVQNAFTKKAREKMEAAQREGQRGKKGRKRDPRNFEEEFPQAKHTAIEGWDGIPAAAIRNGLISACRLVNFKMTIAKLSLFVQALLGQQVKYLSVEF